jgi:hypothetical protein
MLSTSDPIVKKNLEDLIQYIIFCALAEGKAVIKRVDINKNILKEHSRFFRDYIKEANEQLNRAFGLSLVDISNNTAEKFGVSTKFTFDADLSGINSRLKTNDNRSQTSFSSIEDENDLDMHVKYSMLMISLSLIFMNGNEMDSDLFWDCLKRFGISKDDKKHKRLGDVSKYFTSELVREGYLEHEAVGSICCIIYLFKFTY